MKGEEIYNNILSLSSEELCDLSVKCLRDEYILRHGRVNEDKIIKFKKSLFNIVVATEFDLVTKFNIAQELLRVRVKLMDCNLFFTPNVLKEQFPVVSPCHVEKLNKKLETTHRTVRIVESPQDGLFLRALLFCEFERFEQLAKDGLIHLYWRNTRYIINYHLHCYSITSDNLFTMFRPIVLGVQPKKDKIYLGCNQAFSID